MKAPRHRNILLLSAAASILIRQRRAACRPAHLIFDPVRCGAGQTLARQKEPDTGTDEHDGQQHIGGQARLFRGSRRSGWRHLTGKLHTAAFTFSRIWPQKAATFGAGVTKLLPHNTRASGKILPAGIVNLIPNRGVRLATNKYYGTIKGNQERIWRIRLPFARPLSCARP
jgi:hypothetical protein